MRWVDGTRVVVTAEANQALLLVNVTTGAIERVFRTEAGVSHMLALSTDRTRLYCSNMRDGSVSAFDFRTGAKIKDVKTGAECEGVGVTPDGRWVWAATSRRARPLSDWRLQIERFIGDWGIGVLSNQLRDRRLLH